MTTFVRGAARIVTPTRQGMTGPQGPVGPIGPGYGYANQQDGQYTAASPLVVMPGAPVPLTVDGLGPLSDSTQLRVPFSDWPFWRGNRFYPLGLHDSYLLRASFSAASVAIDNAVRLSLDIGGAIGTFFDDRQSFDTVAGEVRIFNFEISFYDASTFFANGAGITVEALTAPMGLWGATLFVQPISVGGS